MRPSHRWSLLVAVLVTLVVAQPAVGAARGGRSSYTRTTFTLTSRPFRSGGWRWRVSFFSNSAGSSLTITAAKELHGGDYPVQTHTWRFFVPSDELTTDHADLMPTRLNTGTDLGAYGAIDVSLQHGTTLRSRSVTCPSSGVVLQRIHSRTGTFSGTFDFKPGSGLPADVASPSFTGTIAKTYETRRSCDEGRAVCLVGRSFFASGPTSDERLSAQSSADATTIDLLAIDPAATADVQVWHEMRATVPRAAVALSRTSATIHGKALAPWASGTLRFTVARGGSKERKGCRTTFYSVDWTNGSITAHFATGDVSFAAPFSGSLVVITKV